MGKGRLCLAVLPSGLAEKYYEDCFTKPSAEIYRLTGSSGTYRKEDVVSYYNRIVNDSERFDFMLMAPDRTFIGESVINELDRKTALLTSVSLSLTRVIWDKDWALGQLKRPETLLLSRLAHRLELEVFPSIHAPNVPMKKLAFVWKVSNGTAKRQQMATPIHSLCPF